MADVRVIRRWARAAVERPAPATGAPPPSPAASTGVEVGIVAIGASTGGPPVLKEILSRLPADFPVPVLVVQHIAAGFIEGFAAWLQKYCAAGVAIAAPGEAVTAGRIYLAPDHCHMGVDRLRRIVIRRGPAENGHCPSVSFLFRSVREAFGKTALGILLTGMGDDGARELRLLKDAGALTIAQDEASSVVFGMPGEAARMGGARSIMSPGDIADYLVSAIARHRRNIPPFSSSR